MCGKVEVSTLALFFSLLLYIHRTTRRCFLLRAYNPSIRQEATNVFKQTVRQRLTTEEYLLGMIAASHSTLAAHHRQFFIGC